MKWRRVKRTAKSRHARPGAARVQPEVSVSDEHRRQVVGRVGFLYGMVFVAMSTLIARLGYLQIARGAEFRSVASTTMLSRMAVLPARGWIYDSNGNILAYDQPSFSIYLTVLPDKSQNFRDIAAKLAPVFHTNPQTILNTIEQYKGQAQIPLFRSVTSEQLAYIEENKSELPGINIVPEGQRVYPNGDLAGQVLGYVGSIAPGDVDQYVNKLHYLRTQIIGKSGLEQEYEGLLQGKVGYEVVQTNNEGVPLKVLGYDPAPTPGYVLQLTLDGHLQAKAQQVVMDAVQKANGGANLVSDAEAVMLDVRTGGVLCMVSYPYYDPNWFTVGGYQKHLKYLSTSGAWMNHVIQSPRYPGSTVKPANLITGFVHGVVTPTTGIYDHYTTMIGRTPIHDDGAHGWVDPIRAITVSCDTFFYEVGLWLGKWFGSTDTSGGGPDHGMNYETWLHTDFVKGINALFGGEAAFGLGELTGIDLPNEQKGIFFIKDYRKGYAAVPYDLAAAQKAIQKQGYYVNYGTPADLADAAIGQSQEFTPMELAQYVATIANNGVRLKPHLLDKVYPPNTRLPSNVKPLKVFKPVVMGRVNAKPEYFKIVQQGMYGVVNTPGGTAYGVFSGAPYTVAGKTGTAQIYMYGRQVDNSVFICYAPFDHPQVALAVMVPGGGYGADTAAPIARQLLDTYFKEHHEFFPKDQWEDNKIPADWKQMPAYRVPEESP